MAAQDLGYRDLGSPEVFFFLLGVQIGDATSFLPRGGFSDIDNIRNSGWASFHFGL